MRTGRLWSQWKSGDQYRVSKDFPMGGGPAAPGQIVIRSILPDPSGADTQDEEVVLRNKGTSPVVITGWRRSGPARPFSGSVTMAAGESRTIQRNGRPMSLNNGGDDIRLIDADGSVVDQFEYRSSSEGMPITTGH
jgi:hypothetical protein